MKIDIKELLATTPESLAGRQLAALKVAAAGQLRMIADLIEKENFEKIADLLFSSPSGDCMGCDNQCIDFSHLIDRVDDACASDIGSVLDRLSHLKKIVEEGRKSRAGGTSKN